jgi:hypothetical protein
MCMLDVTDRTVVLRAVPDVDVRVRADVDVQALAHAVSEHAHRNCYRHT